MNREFLDLYNTELQLLKEHGKEFAEAYPEIAERLGGLLAERTDPMISGLLEGTAFLAARVQLKLQHEFPEFTNNLLEQLVPNYLASTPSVMIVQAQANYGNAALREGMRVGTADSPLFKSAPLFLKEALTFPYNYGLDFVGQVVAKRGNAGAVDLFQNPPTTTRQIMEPATYLAGEKLPPLPVPDFKSLFKDFEKIDVGGFGEFDTAMLVDQFAGTEAGHKIYPEWRGGYYFAVKPKANPAAPLRLLYVSREVSMGVVK